ncbi:GIY-YIG nuclease family protein [Pararhizobium sp. BT-229]|uniref:GIY-YIG nuclease family protein n=1 Tax=Pararhizobium sp. BT-229 TaxID=2986923 RepID=UPI0021F6C7FE|nr:GIY-YIG nuclease family protein [Pararhizobium sp. BT-229]MCV9963567.1 GIY-YIG nuclease family protein [Pararhizobium sp. BT-229]
MGTAYTRRAGFVYLLSNPSMPGMVKIGRTTRDPATRAGELTSASGVPTPFRLEGYVRSPDAVRTEAAVHRIVGGDRVNSRREFFRIDPARAMSIMRRVASDERLVFRKQKKSRGSWTAILHLLLVLAYFNGALAINGFDHSVVWKAAAVNAVAILLPSGIWNRLMRSFRRRPLPTHLVSALVTVGGVSALNVLFVPLLRGVMRAAGL